MRNKCLQKKFFLRIHDGFIDGYDASKFPLNNVKIVIKTHPPAANVGICNGYDNDDIVCVCREMSKRLTLELLFLLYMTTRNTNELNKLSSLPKFKCVCSISVRDSFLDSDLKPLLKSLRLSINQNMNVGSF